jgi:RNA polymerase sigma factor (sigma-70 family)
VTVIEGQAEQIFQAFWPRLLRASQGFLGAQAAEAEDMVRDTYLAAFPRLDRYDPSDCTYDWLRQICLRQCYARLRSREGVLVGIEHELKIYRERCGIESLNTANLELLAQQQLELLRELIKGLPPESRQVIQLRNVHGMTYAQIGETLGLSGAGLMARLLRARAQIRELLVNLPVIGAPDKQPIAA